MYFSGFSMTGVHLQRGALSFSLKPNHRLQYPGIKNTLYIIWHCLVGQTTIPFTIRGPVFLLLGGVGSLKAQLLSLSSTWEGRESLVQTHRTD